MPIKAGRQEGLHRPLPDYLRPRLKVIFIGYNPGLKSAECGHYYAHPSNHFWPLLFESGLVSEQLSSSQDSRLLEFGMGLTDIVKRASRGASGLAAEECRDGTESLKEKIRRYRPLALAFVGKGVYEKFVGRRVSLGPQAERVFGARVFVLPSTSGANASVPRQEKLRYFRKLRRWLDARQAWAVAG